MNTCSSLPKDFSVFLPDGGTYSTCIQDEQNRLESQYFWMQHPTKNERAFSR